MTLLIFWGQLKREIIGKFLSFFESNAFIYTMYILSLNKLYRIMSSNDSSIIFKIARYLIQAFETRKQFIDTLSITQN